MKVIGLTGNIASGKSVVADMLRELGAKIIDADLIARLIVQPGEPAWDEIREEFGEEILNQDQTINRHKLGEVIFNDARKREELNKITHPRIIERIKEIIEAYRKENIEVVVVEAALIVEKGGMKPIISDLIVVSVDPKTQMKRLVQRNGFTEEEARNRIESQMPNSEKVRHATYVIDNSLALEETRKRVKEIWKKINS